MVYTKTPMRRTFKVKAKPNTKNAMVKLIKKVVKGTAETGSSYFNPTVNLVKLTPYCWNLASNLGLTNSAAATIDNGRITGDSIQPIGISIKGYTWSLTDETAFVTLALVRHSTYSVSSSALGINDITKAGDNSAHLPRFNSEEVKVLWTKRYIPSPVITNKVKLVPIDEYIPLLKKIPKIQFKEFNTNYDILGGNYYLVGIVSNYTGTTAVTSVAQVDIACRMFYKDF